MFLCQKNNLNICGKVFNTLTEQEKTFKRIKQCNTSGVLNTTANQPFPRRRFQEEEEGFKLARFQQNMPYSPPSAVLEPCRR